MHPNDAHKTCCHEQKVRRYKSYPNCTLSTRSCSEQEKDYADVTFAGPDCPVQLSSCVMEVKRAPRFCMPIASMLLEFAIGVEHALCFSARLWLKK
eukprot:1764498-Amphidinium_carterae.1